MFCSLYPVSTLSTHPKVPPALRRGPEVSAERADWILMALINSETPKVTLEEMQNIRDRADEHSVFDIEYTEQADGRDVARKVGVSQYVLASAYCDHLARTSTAYITLACYIRQLRDMQSRRAVNVSETLAALATTVSNLPVQPRAAPDIDLWLQGLPTHANGNDFRSDDFEPPHG